MINTLSAGCVALVGTSLIAGQQVSCTYTVARTARGTYPNTASTTVQDDEGNSASDTDSSSVTVTDVLPTITVDKSVSPTTLLLSGGSATFTVKVTNTSPESVTLTALVDNKFGNLNGQGTCSVPQTLAANGGTYTCSFTKTLVGQLNDNGLGFKPHINRVTATANDNEGNVVTALTMQL